MGLINLKEYPHRRYNPLTREWVLVSPHRTQRPWQGQVEKMAPETVPDYDPSCYMCPGNVRAGGMRNPTYASTFVFDNDFAALLSDTPEAVLNQHGLIVARSERGVCRVICFSPRHSLTLSRMEVLEIRQVVNVWTEQYRELGALSFVNYVQIFENRGAMTGASNPHPHCQVWASAHLPNELTKEDAALSDYYHSHKACLLCDYWALEQVSMERLVCDNQHFAVLVPFWAIWPFETLLISKRHVTALDELTDQERDALAEILKRLTTRYDNLFGISFPYSMGFHQRPSNSQLHREWHFHAHFYPPLLRSATVRKFMVGYEMLATPQRDITAESVAQRLRESSEKHYRE